MKKKKNISSFPSTISNCQLRSKMIAMALIVGGSRIVRVPSKKTVGVVDVRMATSNQRFPHWMYF